VTAPDAATGEATEPDAATTEAAAPDAATGEATEPDAATTEVTVPETATGEATEPTTTEATEPVETIESDTVSVGPTETVEPETALAEADEVEASSGAVSPAPVGQVAAAINLPKVDYFVAEPINLTLIGLEDQQFNVQVVIAENLAPDSRYITMVYPTSQNTQLLAPNSVGHFEIRLYSGREEPKAENLLAKASIVVTGQASGAFKVKVPGSSFNSGQRITVEVSEVSESFIERGAFVGVFPKGAKADQFTFTINISEPNEELFLDLPLTKGLYEIRAHASNNPITNEGLVEVFQIEIN
jgi:hypothetical protein